MDNMVSGGKTSYSAGKAIFLKCMSGHYRYSAAALTVTIWLQVPVCTPAVDLPFIRLAGGKGDGILPRRKGGRWVFNWTCWTGRLERDKTDAKALEAEILAATAPLMKDIGILTGMKGWVCSSRLRLSRTLLMWTGSGIRCVYVLSSVCAESVQFEHVG